jgi:hypothetical protein
MVLHNYIREQSSGDVDFANCDWDPNFVPTIPDRYKYAVASHVSDDSTSKQVFLRSMHFMIVLQHPFLFRGVE